MLVQFPVSFGEADSQDNLGIFSKFKADRGIGRSLQRFHRKTARLSSGGNRVPNSGIAPTTSAVSYGFPDRRFVAAAGKRDAPELTHP